MAGASSIWQALTRKQVFEPDQLEQGNLRRCLSVWDLTALGVGSTLGVGVYVIVGSVALHLAGPSIVLSFLIAAVASLFAGLCYAEFGARVPKAGSAYIYTYVTVGEFVAFIIGWNMILEALFGTASVAKGLSLYVDSMVNKTMSEWFTATMPIGAAVLSPYFDLLSFIIVLILGVLLAIGVRESSMVNNVFAGINMLIILFIIIAGAFKANSSNWSIPEGEVPAGGGAGGFFPFGVWGMLRGAAVCFYGFVGFDTISSTGEEVRSPRRALPLAIVATLGIVFLAYASVATVITMMVPYYLQDDVAAVATVFSHVGLDWARWIVSIGAVFGISASLFGAMFPLPRLLYSMATDGLLWHLLARLNSRKTPVIGTLIPAVIIAILAAIVELNDLVLMMCIGTLLSYTIVAVCIIILRYRSDYSVAGQGWLQQMAGLGLRAATTTSALIVHVCLLLFTLACVSAALVGALAAAPGAALAALHAAALLLLAVMALQPQVKEDLAFKTPLVPIVPCLSIYVNIHLMVLINVQTWIRVAVWMAIGIPIYILCICIYKRKDGGNLQQNIKASTHVNKNGKPPVQIVVETPTPPGTTSRSNTGGDHDVDDDRPERSNVIVEDKNLRKQPIVTEEIIVQHAYIEDNEEKEAKIIDLLDQVLQAEEDSYGEIISLKEHSDDDVLSTIHQTEVHRKSLSELSDAGSDASMGNQVLSKYDVIAQVHREDLPKVNEEDEVTETNADLREDEEVNEHEEVTAFNDSDTNSRTDESGYSDTIDRINESAEDMRQETINIPKPPPLDENYFKSPTFKKAYTISARSTRPKSIDDEEMKPRESIASNNSYDDGTMVFGSDKQMNFMSKLENIFQNKMSNEHDTDELRKRSQSTGNVAENTDFELIRSRPSIFLDLKKELLSRTEQAQSLKPAVEETNTPEPEPEEEVEETSLSREDLKSKLETIFAAGGPQLLKPRFMKSNPPTPEESYQTDTSSTESIAKLPKVEKNDTLKRQKDRYGEVLNSFRLSLNKGDEV
ncbi:cationic amino acid transporter 2-like [Epargyreus clarus]|uniref:cationic amino acid transporter 2-like n=1 Tax=Epargyreus clarus TaxID=520877 RepID=UPI003C2C9B8E